MIIRTEHDTSTASSAGDSPSSEEPTSSASSDVTWVDYVRIMLLSEDRRKVLLRYMERRWDLPYFIVTKQLHDDVCPVCLEFENLLGVKSPHPVFNVVVDLLGHYGATHPRGYDTSTMLGYSRLLLVEARINVDDMNLPADFSWHDAQFVSSLPTDREYDEAMGEALQIVHSFLILQAPQERLLPFPPFQFGWFDNAAEWFGSRVEELGAHILSPAREYRVSHSSVILELETSQGPFFLKSPMEGCSEILITTEMLKLFPQNIPHVVATCDQLRTFIMRGFDTRREDKRDQVQMLRTLGRVQIESMPHVNDLVNAGVETLSLDSLEEKLRDWVDDNSFQKCMRAMMQDFQEMIPVFITIINDLKRYNFPMCIVHGDFDERNTGFHTPDDGQEHLLIFDWQFSRISHPLFEFHQIHEDIAQDALEGYLSMWSDFEPLHRAREAYELARILGWLVKIDASIPCIRADVQKSSVLEEFVFDCFQCMERAANKRLAQTAKREVPYDDVDEEH